MSSSSNQVRRGCRQGQSFLAAAVGAVIMVLAPGSSIADPDDTLVFDASQTIRHDSNLFGLPDGVQPGGSSRPRSAASATTELGFRVDKTWSLQQLTGDASITRDVYAHYGNLNYTGRRIDFRYAWKLTPSIGGNLIYQNSKQPISFEFTGYQTEPNPRKIELKQIDIDWRPGAALHPRFSIFQSATTNERPTFQVESSKSTSYQGALVYQFRSANTAEVYVRRADGDYDGDAITATLVDRKFHEMEYGVRASLKQDGPRQLSGNIGYLDRKHETFGVRNFDGFVGRLQYSEDLTGKLQFRLFASRSLRSSQTLFGSYYAYEVVETKLAWTATGKITVLPGFSYRRQNYQGAIDPTAVSPRQTTREPTLQIDYAALRGLDVNLGFRRPKRTANDAVLQYEDRVAWVGATFKF